MIKKYLLYTSIVLTNGNHFYKSKFFKFIR